MTNINLCTLFDSRYLHKGLALLASIQKHVPLYHVWVLALDDATWQCLCAKHLPNVTVTRLDGIETGQLQEIRKQRTYQEYVWGLASWFTAYTMEAERLDSIAYMDSDCYLFGDLAPLYAEVRYANVAVIPHRWTPKYEQRLRPNGVYNVSWVYFTQAGLPCLREWRDKCLAWCYARNEGGWFADQGYWDTLAPQYGAYSIKHIGCNLAPWNAEQYDYAVDDFDGRRLFVIERNDGRITRIEPIVFYHFHEWQSYERRTNYPVPLMVAKHIYLPYEQEIEHIRREL